MTKKKEAPAAPRPVGRPRRARWPELPNRCNDPAKLNDREYALYESVKNRGRITPDQPKG